jgi:class 3 adenylate cyclase
VTTEVDLQHLLDTLAEDTKAELACTPIVEDWDGSLDVGSLPITARKWIKVTDVVAVVADLKNSTRLGTRKWAASTASIYQAATGGVVKTFDQFDADFIQIQGDGAFALFWGNKRYERAMCAAITIRTSSVDLVDRLESKWTAIPETGFKVGVASDRVLVKRIGTPRNPAQQEPVWAGKPVNYAAKAAQCADRHEIIVTGSVWDTISPNDYLAFSCGCDGNGEPTKATNTIWEDLTIERLPEDDHEREGRRLIAPWCRIHGPEFCAAILAGKRQRSDVDEARMSLTKAQMANALRVKAATARENRRRRLAGLAR